MDKKIVIIGSNGYLGSFLSFKYENAINVISDNDKTKGKVRYSDFLEDYNNNIYNKYIIMICSSYDKIYLILNDLEKKSTIYNTFILFSSAVIYDGINLKNYEEDIEGYSEDNYVKYVKNNEEKMDFLEGRKIILRLGTLYGFSPYLCATRGVQRMIFSSLINNKLIINNPSLEKTMLSLEDLYLAINVILDNRASYDVYNVGSFDTTIEILGEHISKTFNVPIEYIEDNKKNYNFILNCNRLKRLGWLPKSNIDTFFDDITTNIHLCKEIKYNNGSEDIIIWHNKDNCRVCNSTKLFDILDLTNQVSPNRLSDKFWKFIKYPLKLKGCKSCFHLQLQGVMNPIIMYKNYTYLSGTATTMRKYFSDLVDKIDIIIKNKIIHYCKKLFSNNKKKVLDIACNDGALLDYFYDKGYETFGIDPAENIMKNITNHNLYCGFFNEESIKYFNGVFDVVTALNVFAHVDDIYGFLNNINKVVTLNSDIFIQTSQCNMIQNNEFDTIYHEHLSFFNMNSMIQACNNSNFYLHNVEIVDVHGSSYLFHLKQKSGSDVINHNVFKRLEFEIASNLYSIDKYFQYETNILEWKDDLIDILKNNNDKLIICCGASAKGITILQYIHDKLLENDLKIDCFIDENKLKINQKVDCVDADIRGFDYVVNIEQPILFILTAWNFKKELIRKINNIRPNNNTFLNLFPLSVE